MAKLKSSITHLLTRGLKDKCQDLTSNPGCGEGCVCVKIKISFNCWPAEKVLNLGYRILSPLPQPGASSLCALAGSAKGLFCKQSPELTKSLSSEIPPKQSLHTSKCLPSEWIFQTQSFLGHPSSITKMENEGKEKRWGSRVTRRWNAVNLKMQRGFPGAPVAETLCFQCRGLGSIPAWGTRSHMRQLRNLYTVTKTWHSQVNKY